MRRNLDIYGVEPENAQDFYDKIKKRFSVNAEPLKGVVYMQDLTYNDNLNNQLTFNMHGSAVLIKSKSSKHRRIEELTIEIGSDDEDSREKARQTLTEITEYELHSLK